MTKHLFLSRHEIIAECFFNPPRNLAFTHKKIHFIGKNRSFALFSKFTNEINRKRFDGIFPTLSQSANFEQFMRKTSCAKRHYERG